MRFELTQYEDLDDVQMEITKCQNKKHIQQVAYSTYHSCLTQLCFTCLKIRTSMSINDLESAESQDANIIKEKNPARGKVK